MSRSGVVWLATHTLIFVSLLVSYVLLRLKGIDDETLKYLLIAGGGFFFGAVTKEAVAWKKDPQPINGDPAAKIGGSV